MSSSFHYLVMAQHSIFQKKLLAKLKDSNMTIGQPKILDYLKDCDGASQKDIAHGCHIEPGTLTTLLNRMEDAGLVERRTLGGNRRSYYIFMTEKGRAMSELITNAFDELEEEAFNGISPEDQAIFMDLFQKIHNNSI